MESFFEKTLTAIFTAVFVTLTLRWANSGSSNRRLYAIGLMACLISLSILIFDLFRYRYSERNYSAKQITVKQCQMDELHNGKIVSSDNSAYKFNRALFWKVGSESDLAQRLCAQKNMNIWLNAENEISGVESEQLQIPLRAGIETDNSKHDFLSLVFIFAPLGLILMLLAIYNDKLGVKIDPNTFRLTKIRKKKIDTTQY